MFRALCLSMLLSLIVAAPARAELVFFATGKVMSVKGHETKDDRLVLHLREGGEFICPAAVVARIEPDEVPYPEPVALRLPQPIVDAEDETTILQLRPEQERYNAIITRVSAEQGVDAKLIHAVIQVESNYQERARSPKGAMGLMQLMPGTARQYSVDNPYDPVANIEGGVKYLKSLLDRFPTKQLALAAYNAGEAAVQRFRGIPPYEETRNYVTRVLDLFSH